MKNKIKNLIKDLSQNIKQIPSKVFTKRFAKKYSALLVVLTIVSYTFLVCISHMPTYISMEGKVVEYRNGLADVEVSDGNVYRYKTDVNVKGMKVIATFKKFENSTVKDYELVRCQVKPN